MLRSGAVLDRTVFFCGGYAAKYGYGPAYDENMTTIRRWIRQAGFEVRTDFQKVASWKLAADNLHWDVEMNRQLAEYWKDLLLGDRPTLDDDEIPPDIPLLPHVPSSMPPPSSQRSATPSFLHADGDPTIPAYQSDTLPLWMTQDVLPFSQRGSVPRAPAQPTRATRVEVPPPTRNWWDSDEEKEDTLESPHFAEPREKSSGYQEAPLEQSTVSTGINGTFTESSSSTAAAEFPVQKVPFLMPESPVERSPSTEADFPDVDLKIYDVVLIRDDVNEKWGLLLNPGSLMVETLREQSPAGRWNEEMRAISMPAYQIKLNDVLVMINGCKCVDLKDCRELFELHGEYVELLFTRGSHASQGLG